MVASWDIMGATWEFPKIRGTLFWGPHNKDPNKLGYYIRIPHFRKLAHSCSGAERLKDSGDRSLDQQLEVWSLNQTL